MTYVCQRIPAFVYQQIVDQEIYFSGFKTDESSQDQAVCVYGGHLQKCEKILTLRSPVGLDRRSASRTEPEER